MLGAKYFINTGYSFIFSQSGTAVFAFFMSVSWFRCSLLPCVSLLQDLFMLRSVWYLLLCLIGRIWHCVLLFGEEIDSCFAFVFSLLISNVLIWSPENEFSESICI